MKKVKNKLSLNKNVVTQLNQVTGGNLPPTKTKETACTLVTCADGLTCDSCAAHTCGFTCTNISTCIV